MICLSRDELLELSGYRQRAAVVRWLRQNCIQFYVGGDNWPRVLRSTLDGKVAPKTLTRSVGNVAALKEMQRGKAKEASTRPA